MKDENIFDTLERLECVIPEYSYRDMEKMIETDKSMRKLIVSEMKVIKEYMFHVVQVSFELQRDKLTEAAEDVWDDVKYLMNTTENSRIAKLKGRKDCETCKRRVEENLYDLIRLDRKLVIAVKDMKAVVYALYRELFTKGREKYFIKNLDKIKTYNESILGLLKEREGIISGG